ncbi:hypothetical protein QC762_506465 [Podospora pseudocomata]|uniref:2EXR domain-containing protein n=1 Tax=Podospora pseudocomata TaxID=2093779 RepID=A0ABR0GCI5_9PEZI|nr:hypothetical protein QC762_506465 [Podospora pseudocomata]
MASPQPTNMHDQPLPGTQNGPYKYLRLYMDAMVPSVPAWRFTRFPELPDELQVMVWEMAMELEVNEVPRIIPVSTFLPPAREIHSARVLAQTCVKSREVALRCLADCRVHEENHQFYADTPQELHFLPTERDTRNRRAFPSRSSRSADERFKSPLHNHVHIDRDYLLFTGHAIGVLRMSSVDAQSYVHGVQKVMVPATIFCSRFNRSMFENLSMSNNLLKTVEEVVLLLPISMKVFALPALCKPSRCPSLSTSGFLGRVAKDVAHHENQRWAQTSEVPYNLIRFWTDEEMEAFAASCSDREKYQPWNHDSSTTHTSHTPNTAAPPVPPHPAGNQNDGHAQSLTHVEGLLQQTSLNSGTLANASASSLDSPAPSVSGADTPESLDDGVAVFRGLQETNSFLYGMFQCWKALQVATEQDEKKRKPVLRFAHVKGTETDDELGAVLARFNGRREKKFGLDWRDYIPARSAEEIRSDVLRGESPLTNVKMSQRYSDTGEAEVESLSNNTAVGAAGAETTISEPWPTASGDQQWTSAEDDWLDGW